MQKEKKLEIEKILKLNNNRPSLKKRKELREEIKLEKDRKRTYRSLLEPSKLCKKRTRKDKENF